MTQIIKDKYKDARFRKGHVVTEADIPLLLSMGKEHLYPLVNSLRIAAISAVPTPLCRRALSNTQMLLIR